MSLQFVGEVTPNGERAMQFYVPVESATDSAFPFNQHDPFLCRVIPGRAVVLTPLSVEANSLDLPPIDEAIKRNGRRGSESESKSES